jgi:hypothetical protein
MLAMKHITVGGKSKRKVARIGSYLRVDDYGIARDIEDRDLTWQSQTGIRDHDSILRWLSGWTDRVDGADDRTISISTTSNHKTRCGKDEPTCEAQSARGEGLARMCDYGDSSHC